MTIEDQRKIISLQMQGLGYRRIATQTGLNIYTVKSYCKAHPISAEDVCLYCGKGLAHTPHKRRKKFCSDICRSAWWSAHPEARKSSHYEHTCAFCGRMFNSDRVGSKYCSVRCFSDARKKVAYD